ncbi:hypothetical protein LINPERPRIM_LOCUS8648 [Linum perenne]
MGNCLQQGKLSSQVHEEPQDDQFQFNNNDVTLNQKQHQEKKSSRVNHVNDESEGMKVKIVLTKEELEWLMYELKVNNHNTNGGAGRSSKKLEEALAEIERNRALKSAISSSAGNNSCWQPSLESISEEVDESER